jgi:hypothetical protein
MAQSEWVEGTFMPVVVGTQCTSHTLCGVQGGGWDVWVKDVVAAEC